MQRGSPYRRAVPGSRRGEPVSPLFCVAASPSCCYSKPRWFSAAQLNAAARRRHDCAPSSLCFPGLLCVSSFEPGFAGADVASSPRASPLLEEWSHQTALRCGSSLHVRPVRPSDAAAACALLSDATAVAIGSSAGAYAGFLRRGVTAYVTSRLASPPANGALLAAYLAPPESTVSEAFTCEGASSLVGVIDLRLPPVPDASRLFAHDLLQPDAAVVSNLCVAPAARRRGVGTALLAGACAYASASARPPSQLALCSAAGDGGAAAMYEAAGFRVAATQGWLEGLLRATPRLQLRVKYLLI